MVPIRLTDLLLRLAEADTFRPLWSDEVLAEVERNLPKLGVTPQKAARRVERMRSAFPDANVTGYQSLVPAMENDPKDRHVLAAAVRANAEVIVTANLRDFPAAALRPYDIVAVSPDDFLLDQLDLYPVPTIQCLHEQLTALRNPPETWSGFLCRFERTVPGFVKAVRDTGIAP